MKKFILFGVVALSVFALTISANAKLSDKGPLLDTLRAQFHLNDSYINGNTDLRALMITSDIDVLNIYRAAGLNNLDGRRRIDVIQAMNRCQTLTVNCLVRVLP